MKRLFGWLRKRTVAIAIPVLAIGTLPIFLLHGRGSDVMQPMAIPSVGGMSIQLITLFIAPCIYCFVQEAKFRRRVSRVAEHEREDLA